MFLIIVLFIYHVKLYEAIEQDDALKIFIFKTLIELDCLITLVIISLLIYLYRIHQVSKNKSKNLRRFI